MAQRVQAGGLSVAEALHRFVEEEALPGTGVEPAAFSMPLPDRPGADPA